MKEKKKGEREREYKQKQMERKLTRWYRIWEIELNIFLSKAFFTLIEDKTFQRKRPKFWKNQKLILKLIDLQIVVLKILDCGWNQSSFETT